MKKFPLLPPPCLLPTIYSLRLTPNLFPLRLGFNV
jgi:hypothetical protein